MRKAKMLRVYLSEADRIDGKPATEAILDLCRQAGLRGATVVRAIEGMGSHGVHTAGFLSLSHDLPLILEAVDTAERIDAALAAMRPKLKDQLVVVWPVEMMRTSEDADD